MRTRYRRRRQPCGALLQHARLARDGIARTRGVRVARRRGQALGANRGTDVERVREALQLCPSERPRNVGTDGEWPSSRNWATRAFPYGTSGASPMRPTRERDRERRMAEPSAGANGKVKAGTLSHEAQQRGLGATMARSERQLRRRDRISGQLQAKHERARADEGEEAKREDQGAQARGDDPEGLAAGECGSSLSARRKGVQAHGLRQVRGPS